MKLSNLILKAIFFVAILSTLVTFVISILFNYYTFQNEKVEMKNEFISLKKEEIKGKFLKLTN